MTGLYNGFRLHLRKYSLFHSIWSLNTCSSRYDWNCVILPGIRRYEASTWPSTFRRTRPYPKLAPCSVISSSFSLWLTFGRHFVGTYISSRRVRSSYFALYHSLIDRIQPVLKLKFKPGHSPVNKNAGFGRHSTD